MPIVPLPKAPSVAPAELPGPRKPLNPPTEAFTGGGRGLDLSGVGSVFEQIAQDEKHKADEIAQTRVGSDLSSLETRLTVATKQRRGQDAFGAPEEVAQAWRDGTSDIGKGLTNETQRVAFQRMAAMHWNALNEVVQTHVAEQRRVYDGQQTDAYITNERNAGLASGNPTRIALSIDNQQIAAERHLRRLGASDDEIQKVTDQLASETHVDYLTQLLDSNKPGSGQLAQSYFLSHQKEIEPGKIGPIERLLTTRGVEGEAQTQSDHIIATATTPEAAMKAAADIQEPNVRKVTEERIRQHFSDQATFDRDRRVKAYSDASKIVTDTGDFDRVPLSLREQLSPNEQIELRRNAEQIRNPKRSTDRDVWNSLINLKALKPDEFGKLNISDYHDQLSDKDYAHLQTLWLQEHSGEQARARAAAKTAETEAKKAKAKQEQHDAAVKILEGAGIHIGPKVPGAALPKPGTAPGDAPVKPGVPPDIDALKIPQSWKDHAATSPDYAEYLRHHKEVPE